MERNISSLEFDLLVIGGGIFGLFSAWDAVLRGLSVAIVDKSDFAGATSTNHFKIIHGGIRYLQHGDIRRIIESSRERSALLRIAPHLAHPLPIVIPTYGKGLKGKALLSLGMGIYELLTFNRNKGIQEERKIPHFSFMKAAEVKDRFYGIKEEGLTGGAIFYEGQYYDPARLAISVLKSAVDNGAEAANYLEVEEFLKKGTRICGVTAFDHIKGTRLQIRSSVVLNTAGPWAHRIIESSLGVKIIPSPSFSRDVALIVKRKINHRCGLAFLTKTKDSNAMIDRGSRHLFAVPWKYATLIGVWPLFFDQPPENTVPDNDEIDKFILEANEGYPGLELTTKDILAVNMGLTLQGENSDQNKQSFNYRSRSILIDHERDHGLSGLITLIGERATMARGMAKRAIDLVMRKLNRPTGKCLTDSTPIHGGDISSFDAFLHQAVRNRPAGICSETMESLVHQHGKEYHRILAYGKGNEELMNTVGNSTILKAQVVHAIRCEMAQCLSDVIFRRTELGIAGYPGEEAVSECAALMAAERGWSREKTSSEIGKVYDHFSRICPYMRNL